MKVASKGKSSLISVEVTPPGATPAPDFIYIDQYNYYTLVKEIIDDFHGFLVRMDDKGVK